MIRMEIHRILFSHRSAVILHADCARDSLIACEYVFRDYGFIPDDIVRADVLSLSKFALFDYSFSVCFYFGRCARLLFRKEYQHGLIKFSIHSKISYLRRALRLYLLLRKRIPLRSLTQDSGNCLILVSRYLDTSV